MGNPVYHSNNKTLGWGEPYHLNTSDKISYEVLVTLLPDHIGHPYSNLTLTTNNTFIDLTGRVDDHFSYTVSVRAVNVVGKSKAAVIPISSTTSELILAICLSQF